PAAQWIVTAADVQHQDALERIVALYYTRARLRPLGDAPQEQAARQQIAWYVAALGQLNPRFSGEVTVPVARLQEGRLVDTGKCTTHT
ncbi:hypothetical protein, partial [Streptomyces sp. GSL17-113]|uniref:hypothetical protein n=1 Tax=Streptomyces sp. GSL17-113 TaxID=3115365 RepID=UPI002E78C556